MLRRRGWSTLSKALERSAAAATVRAGGRRELNPVAIWCACERKAVTVECPGLNPCCEGTVVGDNKM
jgi:hypothetical protein